MKRFNHIHKLAEIRRDVRAFPDSTDRILHTAIVRDLPPQHKGVYEYAAEYPGELTSAFVALRWNIRQNHASMILQELWQFGILERTEYTNEHGKGYRYKISELERQQQAARVR